MPRRSGSPSAFRGGRSRGVVAVAAESNDCVVRSWGVPGSLFGRPRAEVEAALPDREPVDCPLCGRAPRPFGVDFQGLQLARCGACGLEFQHPRPVFEQLAAAVYGSGYHPAGHETVDRRRRRTFARQMRRLERYVRRRPAAVLDVGCGAGAFLGYAQYCCFSIPAQ